MRAQFVTDWQDILAEASHRLQRLLEQETELIVKKIMKEIRKVESSISHEYGPWRSQVLIRKVQEVSGRFEGNLMQRRSRKLDAISVVNEDATVIEDEQFEGDGDNGLELRIHNFVSDIRRTADDALSRDSQLSVEVENLGPEESNAGVNPFPIGCPLLLVDIGRVTRDIDSVLREYDQRREDNDSVECFIEPRSCAQTSRDESSAFESRQIEALGGGDSRAEGDTRGRGYQTVVNLSKRVLTEGEVSLLSKGLKFCPTPEKIDIYSLRQDIKEYVRRVRLKEYFYTDQDDVEGEFSSLPAFRKKSNWSPGRNRELAIEAYVEALERDILAHDFGTPYQRNLTREEQQALQDLCTYDDIIIKQADKGSAVVVMDKEAYLQEAMRQLTDKEIYQPLPKDPTSAMIKKVNQSILEAHRKGNIDDVTKDYLLASGDERAGRFYLLPKLHKKGCPGRPVISGCNTPTEKISSFVDYHLRPIVPTINSYIKDTNDF